MIASQAAKGLERRAGVAFDLAHGATHIRRVTGRRKLTPLALLHGVGGHERTIPDGIRQVA
jgi:hypothetical protein